jgi:hypothetical protein
MAKLLAGASLLLATGLVAGLVWAIRRIQRRLRRSRQPAHPRQPAAEAYPARS